MIWKFEKLGGVVATSLRILTQFDLINNQLTPLQANYTIVAGQYVQLNAAVASLQAHNYVTRDEFNQQDDKLNRIIVAFAVVIAALFVFVIVMLCWGNRLRQCCPKYFRSDGGGGESLLETSDYMSA